jgi:hypothetical protein
MVLGITRDNVQLQNRLTIRNLRWLLVVALVVFAWWLEHRNAVTYKRERPK